MGSGERVRNTLVTCPEVRDNTGKPVLIPDMPTPPQGGVRKVFSLREGLAAYQLVGGVTAHQGNDG